MEKLENLSRGDLKELKEELENLYESYEIEELDALIKSCKIQIMNKTNNINLMDIVGKAFYFRDLDTNEYFIVKVKSFVNEDEIEDILDDEEGCTELCYEGVFFDGDYLSRIMEDDYTLELYGDGSIVLDGNTMKAISESTYNQVANCFDTAKELLMCPKEEGIKFI